MCCPCEKLTFSSSWSTYCISRLERERWRGIYDFHRNVRVAKNPKIERVTPQARHLSPANTGAVCIDECFASPVRFGFLAHQANKIEECDSWVILKS